VPQGRGIFRELSVEENLHLGFENQRAGCEKIPDRLYATFPWMTPNRRKKAGELSGGQQQQLAIARALLGNPRMLLLDEPTDGIDGVTQKQLLLLIRDLARGSDWLSSHAVTILIVEQNIEFVKTIGDDFFILERGTIVTSGPMDNLTSQTIAEYLGD
jgi:urea transport system ATP-binding protein